MTSGTVFLTRTAVPRKLLIKHIDSPFPAIRKEFFFSFPDLCMLGDFEGLIN